jgi:D-glycero-D-manno-heptose 1,7-bisphosphate phosphatase
MGEHPLKAKAVFLDRDGVLNEPIVREGKPYPPGSVAEWKLLPGVREACERLRAAGYLLVVVTNQPDVGRGTQQQEEVEAMHWVMCAELPLNRVEVCYHAGRGEVCDCRKPAPGMLLRAAEALEIDLARSFMVGDRWRDIDAGAAAGCRTVFIERGYSEELRAAPEFRVRDLGEAVEIILKTGNAER